MYNFYHDRLHVDHVSKENRWQDTMLSSWVPSHLVHRVNHFVN